MNVRLLLFASYRDLAGAGELEVQLPEGATPRVLVSILRSRGRLAALPAEPAVAVNRSYAHLDESLRDGDEVALLPPVAGG